MFASKRLGFVLDLNLNFDTQIDEKSKKCHKMTDLIRLLLVNIPYNALLTIYKFLHDKLKNENFHKTKWKNWWNTRNFWRTTLWLTLIS